MFDKYRLVCYVFSHQNIKYLVEVISYGVNHQKKVHHRPLFHRMTTRHVHVSDVNERRKMKNWSTWRWRSNALFIRTFNSKLILQKPFEGSHLMSYHRTYGEARGRLRFVVSSSLSSLRLAPNWIAFMGIFITRDSTVPKRQKERERNAPAESGEAKFDWYSTDGSRFRKQR